VDEGYGEAVWNHTLKIFEDVKKTGRTE